MSEKDEQVFLVRNGHGHIHVSSFTTSRRSFSTVKVEATTKKWFEYGLFTDNEHFNKETVLLPIELLE